MIRAGDLRQRATLQRRVETEVPGDPGNLTTVFQTVAVIWCNDVSSTGKTGRELLEAKKLNSKLSHAIQIRYRDDIDASMRLIVGNAVLIITSFTDPDTRRRELILLCEQELPNG